MQTKSLSAPWWKDQSLLTNVVSTLFIVAGYISPKFGKELRAVGYFALSGALTNWLAIHMLFEKVPFLYGSGVILDRFEEFKAAIKKLVMEQFFAPGNVKRVIEEEEALLGDWFQPGKIIEAMDYDRLYQGLVDTILESSYGKMIAMVGGAAALEKLREPFIRNIKGTLQDLVQSESFKKTLVSSVDSERIARDLQLKIEVIIDDRLLKLTAPMVKTIVQDLIKAHLGWLVVWGGVFGGVIGLVVSVFE